MPKKRVACTAIEMIQAANTARPVSVKDADPRCAGATGGTAFGSSVLGDVTCTWLRAYRSRGGLCAGFPSQPAGTPILLPTGVDSKCSSAGCKRQRSWVHSLAMSGRMTRSTGRNVEWRIANSKLSNTTPSFFIRCSEFTIRHSREVAHHRSASFIRLGHIRTCRNACLRECSPGCRQQGAIRCPRCTSGSAFSNRQSTIWSSAPRADAGV